jgi:pimeloyl-ACP methyl ester carboxylesterase
VIEIIREEISRKTQSTDAATNSEISAVIERASIPGRAREPRVAEQLAGVDVAHLDTAAGKVAAWRVGTGPAVLLVHGWRDSARLWDPLMSALRARDRSFVAVDLPGHGFSEGERCLAAEVADAALAAAAALGPVDAAVAHSFAASGTAMALAEGMPASRLVLIAPPLSYRSPGRSAGDVVDAGRQRWRRIAADLGFDPAVGDLALASYRDSLEPPRRDWDLTAGLAELPADVLLLASPDDERFDIASARALADSLPRCTFVELVGLDHRASARDATAIAEIVRFVT